jgi:hypothetical protein
MSEYQKGEKAKPSDAELKSELAHLKTRREKLAAHLKEADDRIVELQTKLGVK